MVLARACRHFPWLIGGQIASKELKTLAKLVEARRRITKEGLEQVD